MSGPVKVGTRWRHRIMVNGSRVSGTFDTKAAALKWEVEQRMPLGHEEEIAVTKTCAEAFRRYEIEVSRSQRGHRWEAGRLAAMAASSLGLITMGKLTSSHIAAWRDERLRSVQGGTVTREMNLLSHVFSIARKEWHWLRTNPTRDVARPKAKPHRDRRISQEEIDRICLALRWPNDGSITAPETIQQRIALAFLFAIETAMRAGEICSLRKGDVNSCVAHLKMTKNGFSRNVPLSQRSMDIWAMVPNGFGITTATLDAMFRMARKRAGVEGLTFHDTRHEAITRLAAKLACCLTISVFGFYIHRGPYDAGYASGYGQVCSEAKDERAAAAWANTPQGKAAYRLAQYGAIDNLIKCSQPGWKIEQGICYVHPAPDGSIYGWRIR
ncbi:tyrosine-type recombinase/integrase [Duganella sp. CY15W]|uniref:tyrosine-type recombinase/integrase n=1 Tax=Duganella sp. CY15W TaxID=2692172 RepID=UPI00136D3CFA|nr:site-specific integrase [Duganella sp. CY15W]MYM29026.1 tyrosine-type recombinase/integrase [Duganella sp. CY15W]